MSKHTPWSEEQAEKWAIDFCKSSRPLEWSVEEKQAFLAGLAKAAEMIEAAPTVYSSQRWFDSNKRFWMEDQMIIDDLKAKLVGVREIADSDESGSEK